jgi:uncharacterized membrane protein
VSARRKVLVAAVCGLVAGGASALFLSWQLCPLVGWDTAGVIYLAWVWRSIWSLDAEQTARHADREDPTTAAADLMLIIAALASLLAVGVVLITGGSSKSGVEIAFGVASVVVSWAIVHTIFTIRYADLYYGGADGGLDFHDQDQPRFVDFAYLAFTVGMTFQVSDTEVNTSQIRAQVLRHALLSYLFGTVIVALTINLIAGLIR